MNKKKNLVNKYLKPITSVNEYLEQVSKIREQWPNSVLVFRGQEDAEWHLESSAQRRLKKLNSSFIEYHRDLLEKCKLKKYDKREGKKLSDLELLADLQHYGAATCLTDFTRNALVALWFACEGEDAKGENAHGKVFVVNTADEKTFGKITSSDIDDKPIKDVLEFNTRNPSKTHEVNTKTVASPDKKLKPEPIREKIKFWSWIPAHLNERIAVQHSLFIFGLHPLDKSISGEILIKSEDKKNIRKELKEIHNICAESLFPDFVGFAYNQRPSIPDPDHEFDYEKCFSDGLDYYQKGEFDRAIEDYTKAIELKPDFADAYCVRAFAYFIGTGEVNRAIKDYDEAIELRPDDADIYCGRGLVYAKKGEFDRAIEDYNRAIKFKPDHANAYYCRGIAYFNKGDHDRALKDFDKVIELKPNYGEAYFNRALAYENKGDLDRALKDFDKAIKLKRDFADAYSGRGLAYSQKGDHDRALKDFDKAIELRPDDAEIYCGRALAYENKGDHDRAIKGYDKAIELKPDDAEIYCDRALAYENKGDLDRALKDFGKAIKLKPDYGEAYFNRALVYLVLKKWNQARSDLTEAKNKGVDIAHNFSSMYGSVSDFQQKFNIQLPEDIAAMLTP